MISFFCFVIFVFFCVIISKVKQIHFLTYDSNFITKKAFGNIFPLTAFLLRYWHGYLYSTKNYFNHNNFLNLISILIFDNWEIFSMTKTIFRNLSETYKVLSKLIELILIKHQSCPYIETSHLICSANQLTGFYMMSTLPFNELRK